MTSDGEPRLVGVDFSTSSKSAGKNTWIAVANREETRSVDELQNATATLGAGAHRWDVIRAKLGSFLAGLPGGSVVGLDFPFGLPPALTDGSWWALDPDRDPLAAYDSPDELYEHAKERLGADPYRPTDANHGGQPPVSYRMRHQTYRGIDLLSDLRDRVTILPADEFSDERPNLLETYPAAVVRQRILRSADADAQYKQNTVSAIRNRIAIADGVAETHDVADHRDVAIGSDDALDGLLALVGVSRAWQRRAWEDLSEAEYVDGGYIFV